jgi:MFS family permease
MRQPRSVPLAGQRLRHLRVEQDDAAVCLPRSSTPNLAPIGGALADVYGRARMLELDSILFGLVSAACALAPSPAWLIVTRVAHGRG